MPHLFAMATLPPSAALAGSAAVSFLEAVGHVTLHTVHLFLTLVLVHLKEALIFGGFFWLFRRPRKPKKKSVT
jgi:hypothetical protein